LRARFPDDLIRNELGLCLGETRVDLAVVNGHLHGYEIKSDRDSLTRLATQITLYDKVLDYSTIVCTTRHLARAAERVPSHWGITAAVDTVGDLRLRRVRRAKLNRAGDKLAIAQLLWREEAAGLLRARGEVVAGRETRWDLWDRLALLPLTKLRGHVRDTLRARHEWPGG
jgi:hypothetical protein